VPVCLTVFLTASFMTSRASLSFSAMAAKAPDDVTRDRRATAERTAAAERRGRFFFMGVGAPGMVFRGAVPEGRPGGRKCKNHAER